MFNRPLRSFVPSVYEGIVEMEDLIAAEEQQLDIVRSDMYKTFSNTFILTADESGVIMFERMLGIIANPQLEDLAFRRHRILNRLSMRCSYTFSFLKQKLDEVVGAGLWKAYIDVNNYTLYVEASASSGASYSEIEFTITRLKPCNLVFVNVPYTAASVGLSEEISYSTAEWLYRLGSWKLGKSPFATSTGGGIIKMSDVTSIQQALLNDTASFVASDIAKVLINDTIEVSQFKLKQSSDNVVTVEYSVSPEMTRLITNIKLMRADGTVLTQSAVYVPVSQAVISKHIISVKEA